MHEILFIIMKHIWQWCCWKLKVCCYDVYSKSDADLIIQRILNELCMKLTCNTFHP